MPKPIDNPEDAAAIPGKALQAAHDGTLESMRRMGKPGMTFTRWQKFKIWFWFTLLGRRHKAQSIILEEIKEGDD